jgi:DNA-binding NarL/FixJ family response regulator
MARSEKISVLIANDQNLIRQGLVSVLNRQKHIEVVAQTTKLSQLSEDFLRYRPNVLITDLRLDGKDTIETIKKIIAQFPSAAILIVSASEGSEEIYRALRAGVRGYVSKDISDSELIETIEIVSAGRSHMSPKIASKLAERMNRSTLTEREMEVLQLIVKGKSNKEIADVLKVTEDTVKFHVRSILGKLGVSDRTQAATAALLNGIIHPQDL